MIGDFIWNFLQGASFLSSCACGEICLSEFVDVLLYS